MMVIILFSFMFLPTRFHPAMLGGLRKKEYVLEKENGINWKMKDVGMASFVL